MVAHARWKEPAAIVFNLALPSWRR
ncbi:hypothetical protein AB0H20_02255 [Nocardia fluminea]